MFENIQDIILIVLVIIVIYLLYKTTFEKFAVSGNDNATLDLTDAITNAVKTIYKVDIDAMRNLGQIADKIVHTSKSSNGSVVNDILDIPATRTKIQDLEVTGNVYFTRKDITKNANGQTQDALVMDIFPQYMVIAWAQPDAPIGWALCNGGKYVINPNKTVSPASENQISRNEYIQTPDLRGRFILGAGTGVNYMKNNTTGAYEAQLNNNLTPRNLKDIDGEEKHELILEEIPPHNHGLDFAGVACTGSNCKKGQGYAMDGVKFGSGADMYKASYRDPGNLPHNTYNSGGEAVAMTTSPTAPQVYKTKPHNNMPPYYVLTYIMKL